MPIQSSRGGASAKGFGFGTCVITNFICATGGTVTTSGDYKIHTFTGPGSFVINKKVQPANAIVDYLVVAGGAGSGVGDRRGAGGAGGYRESKNPAAPWTASPLASTSSLPVGLGTYPITVGAGGTSIPYSGSPSSQGNPGSNSIFSTITSTGGGGGGVGGVEPSPAPLAALPGGSGGGGGVFCLPSGTFSTAGVGNTPPTSPPQGQPGGRGNHVNNGGSGGGGGAIQAGQDAIGNAPGRGGDGGNGATTSISGSPTSYAGGGGGAGDQGPRTGGIGGGGPGFYSPAPTVGTPGTVNTGGGGGTSGSSADSSAGGSGIILIRYKFQ
jgi:hypothetical protein